MESNQNAAKFFNVFAKKFDTIYDGMRSPFIRWTDLHLRRDMFIRFNKTFEVFGDLRGKTVLDIGCGSGPYVLEAFRRGASRVTAVDPAPNMLNLLRKRLEGSNYRDMCSIVEGIFPGVPLYAHDHVIAMGVMDYFAAPYDFLNTMKSLVKISAAVSFPSKHWFRTPVRRLRYNLRKCPVYFYDENTIRELCEKANYSQIEIYKIHGAGMDFHVCLKP